MKGLMIKDFICLRKQMQQFVLLVVLSVVIAIMFILSTKYGNLALAKATMLAEGQIDEVGLVNFAGFAVMLFMLVPMAGIADMAFIFDEDGKAGFANVASVMPLTIKQRVTARYMTIFSVLGIGLVFDIVIALVLSTLTDIVKYSEFMRMILFVVSLMAIDCALIIFFCILFGHGHEDYARVVSALLLVAGPVICNFNKIKIALMNDDIDANVMMDFVKNKSYILLIIAIVVMTASYTGSVVIAKRKRGVM